MKKTIARITLCIAFFGLCITEEASCQSIWFRFTNGLEDAYNLSDVRKITYGTVEQPALTVTLISSTVISYNYPDILSYYFDDNSVSISERASLNNNRFIVYPNPAVNTVTLSWIAAEQEACRIVVRDMEGRIAETISIPSGALGLRTFPMNVEHLNSGLYIFQLIGKNQTQSTRLIKN